MPTAASLNITCNIAGNVQRRQLMGRSFLVAPITLIVPGVLNGSQGPILYTNEENGKNLMAWNNMPLVIDHPYDAEGRECSARSPDVLNRTCIGMVLEVRNNRGKLEGEAWFDVTAMQTADRGHEVMSKLLAGQPLEMSTGLGLSKVKANNGSSFNGTPYTHIARDYKPDHVAILLDQPGACGLSDGCGVNVKNQSTLSSEGSSMPKSLTKKQRAELISNIVSNGCDCYTEEDVDALNEYTDERLTTISNHLKEHVTNAEFVANAKKTEEGTNNSLKGLGKIATKRALNEMSDEELDAEMKKRSEKKVAENAAKCADNEDGCEEDEEEPMMNADESAKTSNKKSKAKAEEVKLPQSVLNSLKRLEKIEAKQKEEYLNKICGNAENKDDLLAIYNKLSLDELEVLAANAKEPEPEVEEPKHNGNRILNYMGAQGSGHVNNKKPSSELLRKSAMGVPGYAFNFGNKEDDE